MQTFQPCGLAIHKHMLAPGRAEVIAQMAGCFIVTRCDQVLCIFDQHALHERIQLERFLDKLGPGHTPHERQQVIRQSKPFKPLVLPSLSPEDLALLQTPLARAFLAQFFLHDIQVVGTSVIVRTRPCIVEEPLPDVAKLLPALLQDLRGFQAHPGAGDPLQALPPCIRTILNSKACRNSIMFHTKLSRATCQRLLREGAQTKFPFSCAHGRPSVAPLALLEHEIPANHPRPHAPLRFRLRGKECRTADLAKLVVGRAVETREEGNASN